MLTSRQPIQVPINTPREQRLSRGARPAARSDAAGAGEFFDALFAAAAPDDILRSTPASPGDPGAHRLRGRQPNTSRAPSMCACWPGPTPASPNWSLVAVNDDRPFLYDSAVLAAAASGGRIRAAFHPIVTLHGVPTSVIVLMLDAMAAEPARKMLVDGLHRLLRTGQGWRCATGAPCWRG